MKTLVFGSSGFIGKAIVEDLLTGHEVIKTTRLDTIANNEISVDLMDRDSVRSAIRKISPDFIISAAGVVENSDKAFQNVEFTRNIITSAVDENVPIKKIIICGSAAVYGNTKNSYDPVSETHELKPVSLYGEAKREEEVAALELGVQHGLNIVVARIFNPVGAGMPGRLLLSRILSQIKEVKEGKRNTIEVTRLDSVRDYVSVRDIAAAMRIFIEKPNVEHVYNLGSGRGTTNKELINMAINNLAPDISVPLVQTQEFPEKPVASVADIKRVREELNWSPNVPLEESVRSENVV